MPQKEASEGSGPIWQTVKCQSLSIQDAALARVFEATIAAVMYLVGMDTDAKELSQQLLCPIRSRNRRDDHEHFWGRETYRASDVHSDFVHTQRRPELSARISRVRGKQATAPKCPANIRWRYCKVCRMRAAHPAYEVP